MRETKDPVALAYAWLDEQAIKDQRLPKRRDVFNPSGIGLCSRRLYYANSGTEPDPIEDAELGWLTQYGPYGDFAHDQVRFVLRDSGAKLDGLHFNDRDKTVLEKDVLKPTVEHNGQTFSLSGRGDGRIYLEDPRGPKGEPLEPGWYYLELKSVDGYKYRWMEDAYRKGKLFDYIERKYHTYLDQSNMMASPDMLDLKGTYLIIVNRGNCQFGFCDKNYTNREGGLCFPFDAAQWEQQKTKMAMITRNVKAETPPIQGYMQGSKECKQCPYSERCWNVESK